MGRLIGIGWLVIHFATFYHAYRVNSVLNDRFLYEPGAWQMAVAPFIGFLFFIPIIGRIVGVALMFEWLLVLSFVRTVEQNPENSPR